VGSLSWGATMPLGVSIDRALADVGGFIAVLQATRRAFTHRAEPDAHPGHRLRIALIAPPYYDVPPSAYGGIEAVVADLARLGGKQA